MKNKRIKITDYNEFRSILNIYNEFAAEWNRRENNLDYPVPSCCEDWSKLTMVRPLSFYTKEEENVYYTLVPKKSNSMWQGKGLFEKDAFLRTLYSADEIKTIWVEDDRRLTFGDYLKAQSSRTDSEGVFVANLLREPKLVLDFQSWSDLEIEFCNKPHYNKDLLKVLWRAYKYVSKAPLPPRNPIRFEYTSLPPYDDYNTTSVMFNFEHSEGNSFFWTDNGVIRVEKTGWGGERFRIWKEDASKWLGAFETRVNRTLPTTLGPATVEFKPDGSVSMLAKHCIIILQANQVKRFYEQLKACNVWANALDTVSFDKVMGKFKELQISDHRNE